MPLELPGPERGCAVAAFAFRHAMAALALLPVAPPLLLRASLPRASACPACLPRPPRPRPCPAPAPPASLSWHRRRFLPLVAFPSRRLAPPVPRHFPPFRSRCCCVRASAANSPHALHSAEQLRVQLDALQHEAQQVRRRGCCTGDLPPPDPKACWVEAPTRRCRCPSSLPRRAQMNVSKAHSARLRFMRLTHVVEQLRQRAAMDVRMGKEDSARLLLSEKQKVMKALEATRQRAELLEQLTGKLNVAISMKQTVLIEVLSSAPLRKSETSDDTSVHHVSPRIEGVGEETIQSGVDEDDIGSRAGLNSDIL